VANFVGCSLSDYPFRYQRQYEDSETGLYYNRFRYYSPEEGIYISQDPMGVVGGFELYSNVNNLGYEHCSSNSSNGAKSKGLENK
jgi:RHS repeat-associated protein